METTWQSITSTIGLACLLYFAYRVLSFVWHFLRPSQLHKYRHCDAGSWALVTGASDGIGLALSEVLLHRGFNVLLHGRNRAKLEGIRSRLAEEHGGRRAVEMVVADASPNNSTSYHDVAEKAKKLQLTVLVNNLGGISTDPTYLRLDELPHAQIDTTLNVNLRFATHLTAALLPHLHANGPALILNLGSAAGLVGMPYIATYSACKAYTHGFTRALQTEVAVAGMEEKVAVMGFPIGNVTTARNARAVSLFTTGARECAAACLDRVGGGGEGGMVWAHWKHAVPALGLGIMPEAVLRRVLGGEMGQRRAEEQSGKKAK